MKRLVVILLALLMLCGCGKKDYVDKNGNQHTFMEGGEHIDAKNFPVEFTLNGAKCSLEFITFCEKDGAVFIIACVDITEIKKPIESDFAEKHFFSLSPLSQEFPYWNRFVQTEQGNTVLVCSKVGADELKSDPVLFSLWAKNDKTISYVKEDGTKGEKPISTDIFFWVPVEFSPFDDLPEVVQNVLLKD